MTETEMRELLAVIGEKHKQAYLKEAQPFIDALTKIYQSRYINCGVMTPETNLSPVWTFNVKAYNDEKK